MSLTLAQIFALNPTTVVADTDLFYLVQSPYTPGTDAAILGSDLKTALGTGTVTSISAGTGITLTPNPITTTGSVALTVPVTAILGGTGQTNYMLGDTLYSSAANTLAKLAGNITTAKQYLSQTGTGAISAAPSWSTIAGSDITGAALTRVDDTNVTLTLGGTPGTALLRATSLTLGWTGQLSPARGGTGVNNGTSTITIAGNFTMLGAFTFSGTLTNNTAVTFPTSGTLATTSQIINWNNVTSTPILLVNNNGYIVNNGAVQVVFTLPATAAIGARAIIVGHSAGGWRINQSNINQHIHVGNVSSTPGLAGFIESTNASDCAELICTQTDDEFTVRNMMGNLTIG